jgi:hypothetical protein
LSIAWDPVNRKACTAVLWSLATPCPFMGSNPRHQESRFPKCIELRHQPRRTCLELSVYPEYIREDTNLMNEDRTD